MFRDNLKSQIEYKGLIIKELAAKTGISKRTLDTYVDKRGVIPNAEIAVKLAKALDTSVEFLVLGHENSNKLESETKSIDKYKQIIKDLEKLPEDIFEAMSISIHELAKKY